MIDQSISAERATENKTSSLHSNILTVGCSHVRARALCGSQHYDMKVKFDCLAPIPSQRAKYEANCEPFEERDAGANFLQPA